MLTFDTSPPPPISPRPSLQKEATSLILMGYHGPERLNWATESVVESTQPGTVVRALGLLVNRPVDVRGHWWRTVGIK